MRDNNIELLRLILMYLIVLEHVIGHGEGVLDKILASNFYPINIPISQYLLYAPSIMSVDCFIFISGYYGIKFRFIGILRIYVQAFSTALLLFVGYSMYFGTISYSLLLKTLFPLLSNYWWFLSIYSFLYILSPILNKANSTFSKKQFGIILSILFLFNCVGGYIFGTFNANDGYSILNFIFLYLLARYLQQYNFLSKIKIPMFFFFTFSLIIFLLCVYFQKYGGKYIIKILSYNNPLVILSAISFFYSFLRFKIKTNLRSLSCLTLGIYLFHDNNIVRPFIIYLTSYFSNNSPFVILALAFIIYLSAIIIEYLRITLIEKARINNLLNKLSERIWSQ